MWLPTISESSPDPDLRPKTPKKSVQKLRVYQTNRLSPLILIVEEDEDTRLMMKYLLQIWKYRIIETASDVEAVALTESERPDLVLLSSQIQKNNSLTTIERMREVAAHGETEIIFVSAFSEPSLRASVLAAGADDFLVKPINFGHLEEMLKQYLKRGERIST